MSIKVWLDDTRPAPKGWVRCFWPDEVIELLESGEVTHLDLDHDLGDVGNPNGERTGNDVLLWLEEKIFTKEFEYKIPSIFLHADNASARQKMRAAIIAIDRLREKI